MSSPAPPQPASEPVHPAEDDSGTCLGWGLILGRVWDGFQLSLLRTRGEPCFRIGSDWFASLGTTNIHDWILLIFISHFDNVYPHNNGIASTPIKSFNYYRTFIKHCNVHHSLLNAYGQLYSQACKQQNAFAMPSEGFHVKCCDKNHILPNKCGFQQCLSSYPCEGPY